MATTSLDVPASPALHATPEPRVWPAALACWTVLGLLESASAYVQSHQTGHPRTVVQVLVGNMPWWLLWGAFTPVVLAAARRWPLHGRRWPRAVAAHAAAALVVSSAHLVVEGAVFYYTVSRALGVPSLGEQLRRLFVGYLVLDVVTYGAVLGACHALDFYTRLRDSSLRAARLELGLAQARMHALRAELNPHFFFNALNAISGLVRRHDDEAAVRMLARLGELLRVTLDHDLAPEIALDGELALLDRYLDIERVRFGDRLTIDVDCDAAARRALVPSLLLQPLVENAIRHGVARRPGPGRVVVRAAREGAELRVTVTDTGAGPAPNARDGIGLSNTRERLAALYGALGGLSLDAAPGGGCRVAVSLPYRAGEARDRVAAGA